jgi:hypothetical protein
MRTFAILDDNGKAATWPEGAPSLSERQLGSRFGKGLAQDYPICHLVVGSEQRRFGKMTQGLSRHRTAA